MNVTQYFLIFIKFSIEAMKHEITIANADLERILSFQYFPFIFLTVLKLSLVQLSLQLLFDDSIRNIVGENTSILVKFLVSPQMAPDITSKCHNFVKL